MGVQRHMTLHPHSQTKKQNKERRNKMMNNNTMRTFFSHPVNREKHSHPNILLTMLSIILNTVHT